MCSIRAGIVILLRRQRSIRYHETIIGIVVILVDVIRYAEVLVLYVHVLCILRSVLLAVDQRDPIRSGSLVLM